MKAAYKFIGRTPKGLYDFVICTAIDKSIDEVQAFIASKGWTELEYQTSYTPNGTEEYTFNS